MAGFLPQAAQPLVLGLSAAAVWGAADFAGGLATRRGAPAQVVLIAHGVSLIGLASYGALRHSPSPHGIAILYGVLSGVAGGVALMVFYKALAQGAMGLKAALAGLLTAAFPVIVSFLEDGRPGSLQLSGFVVAGAAIWLIAYSPADKLTEGDTASTNPAVNDNYTDESDPGDLMAPEASAVRGLGLSAAAGLGFGTQLVLLHFASAGGSVVEGLMLSRIGGTATAAIAALYGFWQIRTQAGRGVRDETSSALAQTPPAPWSTFFLLATVAGLLDTSGNCLYMLASLAGRLDVAAVLSSLYPAATILLAAWLLKERTTRLQIAGMALAMVAVALISL